MTEVGRHLWRSPSSIPLQLRSRVTCSRSLRSVSGCVLIVIKKRDCTTSLGNLFQCLKTCWEKKILNLDGIYWVSVCLSSIFPSCYFHFILYFNFSPLLFLTAVLKNYWSVFVSYCNTVMIDLHDNYVLTWREKGR